MYSRRAHQTDHDTMVQGIIWFGIRQAAWFVHFAEAVASKTALLAQACKCKDGIDLCNPSF